MFKINKFLSYLSLTTLALVVFGATQASAACLEQQEDYRNTTITAGKLTPDGECFISVSIPFYMQEDLKYRSYFVTSQGSFMVFLSFGDGDEATNTGAREFYMPTLFGKAVSYKKSGKYIDVKQGTFSYRFNADTAQIVSISSGTLSVDPAFTPQNSGGVEIIAAPFVYIDSGFKLGSSPSYDFGRSSTIVDKKRTQCKVENNEIFRRTQDGNNELKYYGNAFFDWLLNKCPLLEK